MAKRGYARVLPSFWTGKTGRKIRAIGSDAQVLSLYLMTAPGANMIGLYYAPIPIIQHETGISDVEVAINDLEEIGFCTYDHDACMVWVHEMLRFQTGGSKLSDKQHTGVAQQYADTDDCKMLSAFYDKYSESFPQLVKRIPSESHSNPIRIPFESHSNTEQEQEQEQEHRTNTTVGLTADRSPGEQLVLHQNDAPADTATSLVRQVFDHYRAYHPRSHKTPQSNSKEWRAISSRIAEGYSVDDLCKAIDGCHRTPHNLGDNERGNRYLGLELIVRNGSQVDRFMENADHFADGGIGHKIGTMSNTARHNAKVAAEFLRKDGGDGQAG